MSFRLTTPSESADVALYLNCNIFVFRAPGITEYLRNGGKLEIAQPTANHGSTRTTGLYDMTEGMISSVLDEIERILIARLSVLGVTSMKMNPFRSRQVTLSVLLLLLVGIMPNNLEGQTLSETDSAQVILEVMNYHITMGLRVPNVYLRVFSDRTIECHTLRFSGKEAYIVKKKVPSSGEFQKVEDVVGALGGP